MSFSIRSNACQYLIWCAAIAAVASIHYSVVLTLDEILEFPARVLMVNQNSLDRDHWPRERVAEYPREFLYLSSPISCKPSIDKSVHIWKRTQIHSIPDDKASRQLYNGIRTNFYLCELNHSWITDATSISHSIAGVWNQLVVPNAIVVHAIRALRKNGDSRPNCVKRN